MIFCSIIFIILIKFIFLSIPVDNKEDLKKLKLIGTYSGGCGHGAMAKKTLLLGVKKILMKEMFIDEDNIEIKMVDLKSDEDAIKQYNIQNLPINLFEFNIFLFYKNKTYLISTSDYANKEYYSELLAGGIGLNRMKNYKIISEKIVKIINKTDSVIQ